MTPENTHLNELIVKNRERNANSNVDNLLTYTAMLPVSKRTAYSWLKVKWSNIKYKFTEIIRIIKE